MSSRNKLLIVQVAALGYDFLGAHTGSDWEGLRFRPMEPVFPAVTCTVQATFRTGLPPSGHGMISNGLYFRDLRRTLFWEQSSELVQGSRIWESFRRRGKKVGILFWQQSLGEEADILLSPAPIHKHHGGMIQDCYSKPGPLYAKLCAALGRPFQLSTYWGPRASVESGRWIASATAALLSDAEFAPDLCLTYLPSLDYDLQRFGPGSRRADEAFEDLSLCLRMLLHAARQNGYDVVIFGDYAMGEMPNGAAFPNRAFLESGLMSTRRVRKSLYPDFHASRAFALVDHEVAHVYVKDAADVGQVARVLGGLAGVGEVLDRASQKRIGLDHPRSGDLVLVADAGRWFAYPWWSYNSEAPDYAAHVDIHSKPGYDPCELFFGFPPWKVSQDTGRIRGSHGRTDSPQRRVCWASTCSLEGEPASLSELAAAVRRRLEECA